MKISIHKNIGYTFLKNNEFPIVKAKNKLFTNSAKSSFLTKDSDDIKQVVRWPDWQFRPWW